MCLVRGHLTSTLLSWLYEDAAHNQYHLQCYRCALGHFSEVKMPCWIVEPTGAPAERSMLTILGLDC